MNIVDNNNIAPGDVVGAERENLDLRAKERLAPDSTYAGDVTPGEAWQILSEDAEAVLVDVRTDAEWNFVGIPDLESIGKKPLLISWQRYPDMAINPNFTDDLATAGVAPNESVLFLCRSGARSADAAQYCTGEGFGSCYNIVEGFEGPPDERKHRGNVSGWKNRALPWVQG